MKYIEIAVCTTSEAGELIGDLLTQLTGEGVAIYDKADFASADWDYCDEEAMAKLPDDVIVKGFAKQEELQSVLDRLHEQFAVIKQNLNAGALSVELKSVDDDEWIQYRKEFFKPLKIGKVVILPCDWHGEAPSGVPVKMDVGIAFGTGEHETTQMCLELGQTLDVTGKKIADLGCGSGILGISFLALGAEYAFFLDYDMQAVEATQRNLQLNEMSNAEVKCGGLDVDGGKYDVVFANLTVDIIAENFENILKFAKDGTYFVFSGILLSRECDMLDLCRKHKLQVEKIKRRGEWTALIAKV